MPVVKYADMLPVNDEVKKIGATFHMQGTKLIKTDLAKPANNLISLALYCYCNILSTVQSGFVVQS